VTKEKLLKKKIGIISLGCDKNRVDTEHMLGLFTQYGLTLTNDIAKANIIIINTCSFIHDARTESFEAILESVGYKDEVCEKVLVVGCLTARNFVSERENLNGVDAYVPIKDNGKIIDIIEELYGFNSGFKPLNLPPNRIISTSPHFAYLKIADGCDNACAYCTIPAIRGRFKSETIKKLVEEARGLADIGVKELILVAQDVSRYGLDLYKKPMIVELLKKLSKIEKIKWIRLHYCYPEMVSDELIEEIATNDKVCKYIDIPLQHINNRVLKRMNRQSTKEGVITLINKLRQANSNITIRSTFIVGFPGETRKEFKELLEFLKEYKLNNVGFFPYSKEPDTTAFTMENQVSERVKLSRLKKAQSMQYKILLEYQNSKIGQACIVLCISATDLANTYIGRSQASSAEVDTVIAIKSDKSLKIGEFYKVKITNMLGVDLEGEVL
jgi:ribosomal protein S12 methylthiotransferase